MIIKYSNGTTIEGVILASAGDAIQVGLNGYEEVIEFVEVNGRWFSQGGGLVQLEPNFRPLSPGERKPSAAPRVNRVTRLWDLVLSGFSARPALVS